MVSYKFIDKQTALKNPLNNILLGIYITRLYDYSHCRIPRLQAHSQQTTEESMSVVDVGVGGLSVYKMKKPYKHLNICNHQLARLDSVHIPVHCSVKT